MLGPIDILVSHDPWLVALAAIICTLSGYMAQPILARVACAPAKVSWFWIISSGFTLGCTVWSVHFVAMLGYNQDHSQLFQVTWTLLSLLMSIVGMTILAGLQRLAVSTASKAVSALGFVAAISAMHYIGMLGVHSEHLMQHNGFMVAAIVALATIPSAVYWFLPDAAPNSRTRITRTGCFVATILIIHFGGMSAMEHMGMSDASPANLMNGRGMVATVVVVTSLIFLFGASIIYLERRSSELFEHRSREGQFINYDTGTANRAGIVRSVEQKIFAEQSFTLIGLSLIGYRDARNLLGRDALRLWVPKAAAKIEATSKPKGTVGYAGGGFFYILLDSDANGLSMQSIERLRNGLGTFETHNDGQSFTFETAIGIVHYPADGYRAEDLVDYCDFAVDCAAQAGSSTLARFEKDRLDDQMRRQRLAIDIRHALRNGELELYYQPQARIDQSASEPAEVIGFEALARWSHPEFGRIPPDVFVPLCEIGGLNPELAQWAVEAACAEFSKWPTQHSVAVNIPPEMLNGPGLIEIVRSALARSGMAPHRLEIEVTESGIIGDIEAARLCIDALHDLGVRVSLDDFGTGNASLQTLFEIPLDKIKLDRMFLPVDDSDPRSLAIVEATAFIADRLNADVLAEGVETEKQLALLKKIGFTSIQGYYIAPALHATEARKRFLSGPNEQGASMS